MVEANWNCTSAPSPVDWMVGSAGAWTMVVSGATSAEASATANGDRLLTTPQTRSPCCSRVTSTHSPSKCRTCASTSVSYGRHTVTSPRNVAVVETS